MVPGRQTPSRSQQSAQGMHCPSPPQVVQSGQEDASQVQPPSAWQTWPAAPQVSPSSAGSGMHAPRLSGTLQAKQAASQAFSQQTARNLT